MGVVPWPWRRPPAGLSARRGVFGAAPTTRAGAPPLRPLTHPWGGVEGCRLPAACGSRRARRVGLSEAAPLGTARLHRGAPSARLCLSANARMCVWAGAGWVWPQVGGRALIQAVSCQAHRVRSTRCTTRASPARVRRARGATGTWPRRWFRVVSGAASDGGADQARLCDACMVRSRSRAWFMLMAAGGWGFWVAGGARLRTVGVAWCTRAIAPRRTVQSLVRATRSSRRGTRPPGALARAGVSRDKAASGAARGGSG